MLNLRGNMEEFLIRPATRDDVPALVEFNAGIARETEETPALTRPPPRSPQAPLDAAISRIQARYGSHSLAILCQDARAARRSQ